MKQKTIATGIVISLLISICSIASASIEVNLPQNPVTLRVTNLGGESYFDTILKNVPSGYDVKNGTYVGWCVDKLHTIKMNHDYPNTYLYSTYNTSMPSQFWHSNWTKVNYVLNHKIENTPWMQIQNAIWYLLDFGDHGLNNDGWSMVENASIYGENYCPTYFEIVGIIGNPGCNVQLQLFEVQLVDPNGDKDGDSISNIDEDLNGDGNPNNDDTDNDGIPNYEDSDDDNDTIPTITEVTDGEDFGQDVDEDGIPNYLDTDSDGDGLSDEEEGTDDDDGDGIPNYLDPNDLQPPSKVDNLTVTDAKDGKLDLNWDPATDNVGIDHYEIFRNGIFLINTTNTYYQDTDLTNGQEYNYTVRAVDTSNNTGPSSDPASGIPTESDNIPPSKVENLTVSDAMDGKLDLNWDPTTDNVGVDHYEIFRNGTFLINVTSTSFQDTGLINGQEYNYTVRAVDTSGNKGNFSDPAYGTPTASDNEQPSKVENLTATDAKDGKLDLSWDPATDNEGIDHYEIYRDGALLINVTSTNYQDTGLTNGQEYNYTVRAVDTSGNKGNFSDPAYGTPTETTYNPPPSPPENPPYYPPAAPPSPPPAVNKPPIADATAGEPYFAVKYENITFNGSLSYDIDQYVESYHWDFGDGTSGEGEIVDHSYSKAGEYTVILTVYDTKGANGTNKTMAVIVEPNRPPTSPSIIGPSEGKVGIEYSFSFVSYDDDNDDIQYTINWGDGNTSVSDFVLAGLLFNATHKWLEPGEYTIVVTADDGEVYKTSNLTITIEEIPVVPESNNFILIILALLALMFLLLLLLIGKKEKDDEEES